MILSPVHNGTDREHVDPGVCQLEIELIRLDARLSMGKLASYLAHELSQPLGAIANYAKGCQQRLHLIGGVPPEILAAMDRIAAQAGRAAEIVNAVCKHFHGVGQTPTRLQVNELLGEVVALAAAEARDAGVELTLEVADDLPAILADPLLIQHVLLVLVRNGLEAMADQEAGRRELTIQAFVNDSGTIQVAVSDRGHGLAEETRSRLFTPFFTTKPGRLGLNLAICKSIIETWEGQLWATPNVRGGAIFQLTLPRALGGSAT